MRRVMTVTVLVLSSMVFACGDDESSEGSSGSSSDRGDSGAEDPDGDESGGDDSGGDDPGDEGPGALSLRAIRSIEIEDSAFREEFEFEYDDDGRLERVEATIQFLDEPADTFSVDFTYDGERIVAAESDRSIELDAVARQEYRIEYNGTRLTDVASEAFLVGGGSLFSSETEFFYESERVSRIEFGSVVYDYERDDDGEVTSIDIAIDSSLEEGTLDFEFDGVQLADVEFEGNLGLLGFEATFDFDYDDGYIDSVTETTIDAFDDSEREREFEFRYNDGLVTRINEDDADLEIRIEYEDFDVQGFQFNLNVVPVGVPRFALGDFIAVDGSTIADPDPISMFVAGILTATSSLF